MAKKNNKLKSSLKVCNKPTIIVIFGLFLIVKCELNEIADN